MNVAASDIRALCLDVDGVLTDGRFYVSDDGQTHRAFDTQDGLAIVWFARLVGPVIICTGKESQNVARRAAELAIKHVIQGSHDKLADMTKTLDQLNLKLEQLAMIGDDLPDLPLMMRCGYAIAVANAAPEVREVARMVTENTGGHGAVREAIEHLLRAAERWEEVVTHYRGQADQNEK